MQGRWFLFIYCHFYVNGEQCSGLYGVTRSDNFTKYLGSIQRIFLYSGMSAATKEVKLIGG